MCQWEIEDKFKSNEVLLSRIVLPQAEAIRTCFMTH